MSRDLTRLLSPRSVAVVGGGAWCESVARECAAFGFDGPIWRVHPRLEGAFASVHDLPGVPDAVFIGVNRAVTVEVVRDLAALSAGGAVCFASGFAEAEAELTDGADMQAPLLDAAGEMPIFGPNCYGFINGLDQVALWPDTHGMVPVERGVAIVMQSSNIALNMTMQRRGLPIAYLLTAGNQAQVDLADLGMAALQDPRVTALGLHIEGIRDIRAFEALAWEAARLGKPIIALKVGTSEQAQAATVSHTASLAGSDAGARALLARLGIGQVDTLAEFLEALKLLHVVGPLSSNRVASMSCSGGEASLMADTGLRHAVEFPPLSATQSTGLRATLGPKVALANPLDYHTYVWADRDGMTAAFAAMAAGDVALTLVVLDFPRADRCDAAAWDIVVEAVAAAQASSGGRIALVSSLPDTMPEAIATACAARGILTLSGFDDALAAIALAARISAPTGDPVVLPGPSGRSTVLAEASAKSAVAEHGVLIPEGRRAWADTLRSLAGTMPTPFVLKAEGIAHKTEAGAVHLGLKSAQDAVEAATGLDGPFLLEEQITGAVAELLIGVVRDPAHGFVLTLGAGGTLTELLQDATHLIVPVTFNDIDAALKHLRIAPLLEGYRGAPAADRAALVAAILAVQDYVIANAACIEEVEINPLLCTPTRAVAADALIRLTEIP